MSKDNIWFPFYINDWFGDTQHFDAAQHGLYLLLVSEYWKNRGPIKLNKSKLQKISRLSGEDLDELLPEVLELFNVEGGCLTHKRVDAELSKLADLKEKRSRGGKASAAKRKAEQSQDRVDTQSQDSATQSNTCSTHVQHEREESTHTGGGIACGCGCGCTSGSCLNLLNKKEIEKNSTVTPIDRFGDGGDGDGVDVDSMLEPIIRIYRNHNGTANPSAVATAYRRKVPPGRHDEWLLAVQNALNRKAVSGERKQSLENFTRDEGWHGDVDIAVGEIHLPNAPKPKNKHQSAGQNLAEFMGAGN